MTTETRRVLLTGFEAFGGLDYNPSWDVAQEIARRARLQELTTQQEHSGVVVSTACLPVEFDRAGEVLKAAITDQQPDMVISLGLAAGTDALRLERVGLNLRDARIPDNAGNQPDDAPVVPGADTALFSTLRLKAAQRRIAEAGFPVQLSTSAGTYVCNDVLYTLLHHLIATEQQIPAGFLHVPDLHAHSAPLTVSEAATAVDLLMAESFVTAEDEARPAGSLH